MKAEDYDSWPQCYEISNRFEKYVKRLTIHKGLNAEYDIRLINIEVTDSGNKILNII